MSLATTVSSVASAQGLAGFPLQDITVPVFHGWLYPDLTLHRGIDYIEPLNTPILAADDGLAMSSSQLPDPSRDTYGTFVLIKHANGLSTLYAHMNGVAANIATFAPADRYNSNFSQWTQVKKGDTIGFVGNSGALSAYTHLHFEVATNPDGTYTGHVLGKRDGYDIYNTAPFYPPQGQRFSACGPKSVWESCPISEALPPCINPLSIIPGVPEPGDTVFPQNVAIPIVKGQDSPQLLVDDFCHYYAWRRQFGVVNIQNLMFNGLSNFIFITHNRDNLMIDFFAEDDTYMWSQADYGYFVTIPKGTSLRVIFENLSLPTSDRTVQIVVQNSSGTKRIAGTLVTKR